MDQVSEVEHGARPPKREIAKRSENWAHGLST
jgi:hypothetical protein